MEQYQVEYLEWLEKQEMIDQQQSDLEWEKQKGDKYQEDDFIVNKSTSSSSKMSEEEYVQQKIKILGKELYDVYNNTQTNPWIAYN